MEIMSTNACIALESSNGNVNGILCLHDGMPKYMGVVLKTVFDDIHKTKKLISLGSLSAVVPYDETVFSEKYVKFDNFMAELLNETVYSFKNIDEFLKPDTWIQKLNIEFLYLQRTDGSWHFYRHDYTGELYEINYDKKIFLQMTNDFFSKINSLINVKDPDYENLSKQELYNKLRIYVHKLLASLDISTITDIHNRAFFEKSVAEKNYNGYLHNLIVFNDVSMQDILEITDFDMLARFIIDNIFIKGNTWLYEIEGANNFMKQHSSIFRFAMNKLADLPKAGYK